MAEEIIELRGWMKETGQDIRLHSEGGGVSFVEWDDSATDNWLALRKRSRGRVVRFIAYITDEEAFGEKQTDE